MNIKDDEIDLFCSRLPPPHLVSRSDALLSEILSGLIVYFDKALGNNLLYRFERAQYVDIRRKTAEMKPMSEIYGGEHLLRLFGEWKELRRARRDTELTN